MGCFVDYLSENLLVMENVELKTRLKKTSTSEIKIISKIKMNKTEINYVAPWIFIVVGVMEERQSTNLTEILEAGEEIMDIVVHTWWGHDAYVATKTRFYRINTSNSGSVNSYVIDFGKYLFNPMLGLKEIPPVL